MGGTLNERALWRFAVRHSTGQGARGKGARCDDAVSCSFSDCLGCRRNCGSRAERSGESWRSRIRIQWQWRRRSAGIRAIPPAKEAVSKRHRCEIERETHIGTFLVGDETEERESKECWCLTTASRSRDMSRLVEGIVSIRADQGCVECREATKCVFTTTRKRASCARPE